MMTKEEAVAAYRQIAEKLDDLRSTAANHISRKDNNAVFELAYYFRDVAERIEKEYSDTEYRTPYTSSAPPGLLKKVALVLDDSCGPVCSHEGCERRHRAWEAKHGDYWKLREEVEKDAAEWIRRHGDD